MRGAARRGALTPSLPAPSTARPCRVHRLGQTRDVHVFRYCVEDSVEERILVGGRVLQRRVLLAVAGRAWGRPAFRPCLHTLPPCPGFQCLHAVPAVFVEQPFVRVVVAVVGVGGWGGGWGIRFGWW